MERGVLARPPYRVELPVGVVERRVDPRTGLLAGPRKKGAYPELFRRRVQPRRDRFWRSDAPTPIVE